MISIRHLSTVIWKVCTPPLFPSNPDALLEPMSLIKQTVLVPSPLFVYNLSWFSENDLAMMALNEIVQVEKYIKHNKWWMFVRSCRSGGYYSRDKKGTYPYYISPIEIGLLWAKITNLESARMLFLSVLQRDMSWGFQKSYYTITQVDEKLLSMK